MTDETDIDAIAAEYVLGLIGGGSCAAVEARLKSEPALAGAVAYWRRRLQPLDGAAPPLAPAPGSWARLKARIAEERAEAARTPVTVRREEGSWEQRGPGVEVKLLNVDAASGARSFLLRLAPGAEYQEHGHLLDEECYMVSGEATVGELHLEAGDYHLIPRQLRHGRTYSKAGALVFVRGRVA